MSDVGAATADVAVVGAGAAGLLAALLAQRAGVDVVLLEGSADGGRKILISGGGRCNILPSRFAPERFVTDSSPNLLRRILRAWPLPEQQAFFERELAMPLELEEASGKLFPASHSALEVRNRLVARVREAGARLWFEARVNGLAAPATSGFWTIGIHGSPPLRARTVVLATGGLSVPKTGSDGVGIELARGLGHAVNPTYPALAPLIVESRIHAHLSGVSLAVALRAPGARPKYAAEGGFLFTHRGYSGPVVLDASHLPIRARLAGREQALTVRWGDRTREQWDEILRTGRGPIRSHLMAALPARLADQLLTEAEVPAGQSLSALPRERRLRLLALLCDYPLPVTGDEGYRKAEVTGGGVDLAQVEWRTLQSKRCAGLFLCGEMLDAFGPIGGYNFQWAWATGRAAGLGAAARVLAERALRG